jgi:putative transcriptional regulator
VEKDKTPRKGHLLVSEPFMQDDNFKHTVVLLCEKTGKGAFGLVLNRPTGIMMHEAVYEFPSNDFMLYDGGPVEKDTVHFITTRGELLDDSLEVAPGIHWGGDFEQLKTLIDTGQVGIDDVRFFLGYSGWDAGQLDTETGDGSWIVADPDPEWLLSEDPHQLWRNVLNRLGGNYKFIANLPENPNLN